MLSFCDTLLSQLFKMLWQILEATRATKSVFQFTYLWCMVYTVLNIQKVGILCTVFKTTFVDGEEKLSNRKNVRGKMTFCWCVYDFWS